jgi:hypothetical protein
VTTAPSVSALAIDPMTAIDRGSNSLSRLRTDIGPGDISSADAECGSLIDRNAGPTLGRTQARAGAAVYRTVHQRHDIGGGRNRASAAAIQLSMSMNASEHRKQCPLEAVPTPRAFAPGAATRAILKPAARAGADCESYSPTEPRYG